MWNWNVEKSQQLDPYHFYTVGRVFKILEIIIELLDDLIILQGALFVILNNPSHDECMLLHIGSGIKTHFGRNVHAIVILVVPSRL